MMTPVYKENQEPSRAKMSYRIQSSTVNGLRRCATRPRACKSVCAQDSFNVHKSFPDETVKSLDFHRELIRTPKYTAEHQNARKQGQTGPNGAKPAKCRQMPPRKQSRRTVGRRCAQHEITRDRVLQRFDAGARSRMRPTRALARSTIETDWRMNNHRQRTRPG